MYQSDGDTDYVIRATPATRETPHSPLGTPVFFFPPLGRCALPEDEHPMTPVMEPATMRHERDAPPPCLRLMASRRL